MMHPTAPLAHELLLPDGRRLAYREWGPAEGAPIIAHHGTPSSGLAVPGGWAAPAAAGVRLVTFDRPGYGGSTNVPGRRVGDAAQDARALADHLGIDRFGTIGTSGGGPHALATAALLPDRVTRLCVNVGVGPVGLAGFDPDAGLHPETVEEMRLARTGEAALRAFVRRHAQAEDMFGAWFGQLPPSDQEVLRRPEVAHEEAAEGRDIDPDRIDGWVEDDLALFARPWGCAAADVAVPTELWYGGADVLVPLAHGEAYAAAIPGAVLHVVPGGGHWLRDSGQRMLRWLAGHDT